MEPRTSVIQKRLQDITHIIPVVSGKGGVGKSMVASTLALLLAKQGKRVGLLDLDLYGPSSHVILGVQPKGFPDEDKGILPPKIQGIKYMSIVYFTEDKPGAFRGEDITNIIIELLAITRWDALDYLIIDMPPGIGDEILDIFTFIPQARYLIVTTSSKVAFNPVEKLLMILIEGNYPILGVVENMVHEDSSFVSEKVSDLHVAYLGSLSYDADIEDAIQHPSKLLSTRFASELLTLIENQL